MISIVIFAAGRGSRLGASVPKFIVEVDSRPIFAHQFAALRNIAGEIYVICGYRAALMLPLLLEETPELASIRERLTFIHNADFLSPQAGSVRRALAVIPPTRPALFIDGDMLFRPSDLRALVDGGRSSVLLRRDPTADAVIAARDKAGQLIRFERGGKGDGEWGNVAYYSPEDLARLPGICAQSKSRHHFELLNELAESGAEIATHFAPLAEIDDIADLSAASKYLRELVDGV
ncbi:MAG: NTP transferase domain-containing protein [Pirellulales bacterium]